MVSCNGRSPPRGKKPILRMLSATKTRHSGLPARWALLKYVECITSIVSDSPSPFHFSFSCARPYNYSSPYLAARYRHQRRLLRAVVCRGYLRLPDLSFPSSESVSFRRPATPRRLHEDLLIACNAREVTLAKRSQNLGHCFAAVTTTSSRLLRYSAGSSLALACNLSAERKSHPSLPDKAERLVEKVIFCRNIDSQKSPPVRRPGKPTILSIIRFP